MLRTAGNRFDVPGGAVLYAGSTRAACYAETLARFRPTPKIRELLRDESGFMIAGGVPQDWRLQRVMARLRVVDPLPFLDVEHPATLAHLSEVMSGELTRLGYEHNLDISDVCNRDRRLTRAIAHYAYTAVDDDDSFLYSGIRYISRVHSAWECWAIFDGTRIEVVDQQAIELSDPDLENIANMWDLRIF